MNKDLLSFIKIYQSSIITDTPKYFDLKFDLPVNKVCSIDFPDPIEKSVTYSIVYGSEKTEYTSIQDFINSFFNKFATVSNIAEISIKFNKRDLISTQNTTIFQNIQSFIKHHKDITLDSNINKLNIILLDDIGQFETKFIKIFHFSDSLFIEDTKITGNDLKGFEKLNNLIKGKKMANYLFYPPCWIDANQENESADYSPLYINAAKSFLSIIKNSDDVSSYIIRGYKTIYISKTLKPSFSKQSATELLNMTFLLTDEQRSRDKLLILRNTITLFLSTNSTLEDLDSSMLEISSNFNYYFNTYVQDKITKFFNLKNKLLDEVTNATKKVNSLTTELQGKLKEISVSLLGTIFLSLLSNIKDIKQRALLNVVFSAYIIYFIINIFIICQIKNQQSLLINNLREYFENFKDLSSELTFDSLFEIYLKKTIKYFNLIFGGILILLLILILLFIGLFITNRFNLRFIIDPLESFFGF